MFVQFAQFGLLGAAKAAALAGVVVAVGESVVPGVGGYAGATVAVIVLTRQPASECQRQRSLSR
jgi:hypothetical protein